MAKRNPTTTNEPAPAQQPSVGRVVHFYDREEIVEAQRRDRDPDPTPALIRRVRNDDGACDLVVFTDLGPRNLAAVPMADHFPQANAWTWPPRV